MADEDLRDRVLREPPGIAVRTADVHDLGVVGNVQEDPAVDEIVVHDDVRGGEAALAAQREEPRVAGTRTHEEDGTDHRPTSSAAPRASSRSARERPMASASAAPPAS